MNQVFITTQIIDNRLQITLNRPQKANALNNEMLVQLKSIFTNATDNENINAVVITGAGKRAFCAGADLTESGTMQDASLWQSMAEALFALPVLTIAMINGPCIGGGMVLALSCDIRIGVPNAQFGYPVLRNELLPGEFEVKRLHSLIGPGRTNLLLLGDQRVSGQQALEWGMLDKIVELELLAATTDEVCKTACDSKRRHVVKMKNSMRGN